MIKDIKINSSHMIKDIKIILLNHKKARIVK